MPPTKKTKAVASIAKKKGISRKAANTVRKTRKATRAKAVGAFKQKYGADTWTTGGEAGRARIGKGILKERKAKREATVKGQSSKKAVRKVAKKVAKRRGHSLVGPTSMQKARSIVRGRKLKSKKG